MMMSVNSVAYSSTNESEVRGTGTRLVDVIVTKGWNRANILNLKWTRLSQQFDVSVRLFTFNNFQ